MFQQTNQGNFKDRRGIAVGAGRISPSRSPSVDRSLEEVSGIGKRPNFASLNSSDGEDEVDLKTIIGGDADSETSPEHEIRGRMGNTAMPSLK